MDAYDQQQHKLWMLMISGNMSCLQTSQDVHMHY